MNDEHESLDAATDPPPRGGLTPHGVTWLGMGANAVLAATKVAAGGLFASQTILADGVHSASDLVTDVAVLAALRVSDRPADGCHPYGHRRMATLVALFVGAALLAAAGSIAYAGAMALRGQPRCVVGLVPLALALTSIVVKELLFRMTRRVARQSDNVALEANAWHHRSDAFSSVAAAAGLAAVAAGGQEWAFMDPLMALMLSAFLITAAVRTIRRSAGELVDRAPAAETLASIERSVEQTPGVRSYHAFRARRVGGKIAMDIHVQVDPDLTVAQGHAIAGDVRRRVMGANPRVIEAVIHVEPARQDNESPRQPGGLPGTS